MPSLVAFLVAGVVLGVLARLLRHGADDPPWWLTVPLGVVGSVIGGSGMDAVLGDGLTDVTPWSFTSACVLAMVLLGLLEGGVGRGGRA
ncbi:MAG: GlsB/YeaQ/YmgE family stress response membrane protein [Nocardioides sp.]